MSQNLRLHRSRMRRAAAKTARQSPADRIIRSGQIAQALLAWLALAAPAAVFIVLWATNRYLAAFGQPGLSSLGDTASFLTALSPVLLLLVATLMLFGAVPFYARQLAESQNHSFNKAFGWLNGDIRTWGQGCVSYLALHAPGLIGILLVALTFYRIEPGYWWWITAAAAPAVVIIQEFHGHGWPIKDLKNMALGLALSAYANMILFVWAVFLSDAALKTWGPMLVDPRRPDDPIIGVGVVLAVIFVHLLTSAAQKGRSLIPLLVAGCMLVWTTGEGGLMAAALRQMQVGGGAPVAFKMSASTAHTVRGCLVLAAGDLLVVWLPPSKDLNNPLPSCSWQKFRKRLAEGAQSAQSGELAPLSDIRAFKREVLFDAPP